MTGNEYAEKAMRTNDKMGFVRLREFTVDNFLEIDTGDLLNGVLGLTGEAGEVSDLVKKNIFHKKPIDLEHLKKELGDVLWYVAMICQACNFDLDDVMGTNIEKLQKRYPEGFDVEKANNRKAGDI